MPTFKFRDNSTNKSKIYKTIVVLTNISLHLKAQLIRLGQPMQLNQRKLQHYRHFVYHRAYSKATQPAQSTRVVKTFQTTKSQQYLSANSQNKKTRVILATKGLNLKKNSTDPVNKLQNY